MRAPNPRLLLLPALLFAAARASARTWPDCLHSGPKKSAPATLADLRACQKKAARRAIDRAKARGAPLTDAELDALGDHQRSEARRYLARAGAVVEGSAPPAAEAAKTPAAAEAPPADAPAEDAAAEGPPADPGAAMKAAGERIRQRYRAAGLQSVPEEDIEIYKAALQQSEGRLTPEISAEVDARIQAAKEEDAVPTLKKAQ